MMLNSFATTFTKNVMRRTPRVYTIRTVATKKKLLDTMDDIPLPTCSWQSQYEANQTKYNLHLAAGVLFFSATLAAVLKSGIIPWDSYGIPPYPRE